MNPIQQRMQAPTVRASEALKACPTCASPNLLHAEREVFCLHCDWNSIELNADAYFGFMYKRTKSASELSVNQSSFSKCAQKHDDRAPDFFQDLFSETGFHGAELAII